MSVNAISSAMAATIYIQKTSRLSDEIIDKLIDLGINPNEVSSNYQANKIIQEAESSNASSSLSSVSTASSTATAWRLCCATIPRRRKTSSRALTTTFPA